MFLSRQISLINLFRLRIEFIPLLKSNFLFLLIFFILLLRRLQSFVVFWIEYCHCDYICLALFMFFWTILMIMSRFMIFKITIIFLFFIFACVRLLFVSVLKWLFDLSFFSNLLRWQTLSDCWFRLNWLSKNLLFLCWLLLLLSSSRVRFNIISYIIISNKIVFLMLNISFIIKNFVFNTEISLIKNNITLWYSSKKDNFFFIFFK